MIYRPQQPRPTMPSMTWREALSLLVWWLLLTAGSLGLGSCFAYWWWH